MAPVLEVVDLSVEFATPAGPVRALRDVSLRIEAGETFGLAGESGSGKTTLGYAIMRDLGPNSRLTGGAIRFQGEDLLAQPPAALRRIRGRRIAMVYQDPASALNPSIRVGWQVAEVLQIHEQAPAGAAWRRALGMLELVNIPDPPAVARRYPHQLSGGMQQRVVIAMALACDPSLLIMDEPTTGLDVTTQARILELVRELRTKVRGGILYISHDLSVIAQVSDRVGILYAGELVETAPVHQLFGRPAHPYTLGLLAALPDVDLARPWPDPAAPARRAAREPAPAVVRMEAVKKYYAIPGALARWLGLGPPPVRAVDGVSVEIGGGEVLALVGESGCGKTTLGRVVLRLLRPTAGRVRFFHRESGAEVAGEAELRRAAQIVFQHPDSSLNPMKRIRRILERPLARFGVPAGERAGRARALLEAVRLDARHLDRFPAELSGGEKQRVAIARAFAPRPEFVVLDEPVSALDVSTQASIVRLLLDLRRELDAAYLFISHDLALVRHVADRVGVMYLGRLVELGSVEAIFDPPYHPYTRALLSAIPVPDPAAPAAAVRLEGVVPSAQHPPSGCPFHTRCPSKIGAICEDTVPPLGEVAPGHWIACHIPVETLRREPAVRPRVRPEEGR